MTSRQSLAQKRQSLADPNYKGGDYEIDTAIENGPLGNRRCTDIFCVLIFIAALCGAGYIGVYAVANGNPELVTTPYDAQGNFCGKSAGYEAYPYLWVQNVDSPFWFAYTVCVQYCPSVDQPAAECKLSADSLVTSCTAEPAPYGSELFLDRVCLPILSTLPANQTEAYNNIIGGFGLDDLQSYARDIRESWKVYLICLVTTFILIFLWNWMLRLCAEFLAWFAIVVVGVGIVAIGFGIKYYQTQNQPSEKASKWLDYTAYTVWGLAGVYALLVLCTYYAIKISIKVLRVSAKIVMNNLRMILIPLFGIAVMVVWILFYGYSLLWLMSCGQMVSNQVIVPGTGTVLGTYQSFTWTDEQKYMMWGSLFMFFWFSAFLVAASQYVLIVAVASWYFTTNTDKRGDFGIMRGYWWLIRYNLGSVLFGSFIIAVVCMIRAVFEYIDSKMKNMNAQAGIVPVQYLMNCIRCALDCCHRFVKYVNENAYCQVVLTGESFCTAAVNGFLLILKHTATFAFTRGIGGIFNLLGKLTISVINACIAYGLIFYFKQLHIKINSPIGPLLIVFLMTYSIAFLFMSLYTTTATCILHCLYADVDICKQMKYDEMVGMNRPKEMKAIVATLAHSKIQPLLA